MGVPGEYVPQRGVLDRQSVLYAGTVVQQVVVAMTEAKPL